MTMTGIKLALSLRGLLTFTTVAGSIKGPQAPNAVMHHSRNISS